MAFTYYYDSPVGQLQLISDGEAITHLLYKHQQIEDDTYEVNPQLPIFQETVKWLDSYFEGENPDITMKLKPEGSEFQHRVWTYLQEIPYGELTTYGILAHKVGGDTGKSRMSAQAIGGAVGRNPISIIIPCHRVVGKNGSLTGYGGTINNKIKLLNIENVDMDKLYVPQHSTKP